MSPSIVGLSEADEIKDVDHKKMPDKEALFWKVCVLCETYMRAGELK